MRIMGFGCVTLNLNIDYKKFVPLGTTARIECTKQKIEGRKAFVQAQLMNLNGDTVHARATAIFYKTMPKLPDYETAKKMFGCESTVTKQQLIELFLRQRQNAKKQREAAQKRKE